MTDLKRWRVWCTTDSKWEYWWLDANAAAPTTCPTDSGHTLDGAKTSIIDTAPWAVQPVEQRPLDVGSRAYFFSPDFTKKETWYGQAEEVINESVGTGDGAQTVFNIPGNPFVVDLGHGKITDEDILPLPSGATLMSWIPEVKVDGNVKAEDLPFGGAAQDYAIDYRAGTITFAVAPPNTHAVVWSGWKVPATTPSVHEFGPPAGKKWTIDKAEVQFSKDVVINDTVSFQAYAGGSPVPGTQPSAYKTCGNYLDFTFGAHPVIPAFGGANRGCAQDTIVLRWEYQTATVITNSSGVVLRVWLDGDVEFGGERATVVFYALEEDE